MATITFLPMPAKHSKLRIMLRRLLAYAIDGVPLYVYVFLYAAAILVFGELYSLCPAANGLVASGTPPQAVGFWTAMYFSATTITTLCYGDVDPIGWSRLIASLEGLVGLSFFGIILTKATSGRLSYHVGRLFSAHAESRLEQFCLQCRKNESDLKQLAKLVTKAFPETPNAIPVSQDEFLKTFGEAISSLHLFSENFCRYLDDETDGDFFLADAPQHALVKSGEDVQRTFYVLTQIFIALSPTARIAVLDEINLKRVTEMLTQWKLVGIKVSKQAKHSGLKTCFQTVGNMSASLSDNLFSAPIGRSPQPDQNFGSDEL